MTLGAARSAWQAQHLEHLKFVLRGKRSTWSTSSSFCVAGAALGAPSAQRHLHYSITHTHHLQDNTIFKTTSSQHQHTSHQHNLINTSPSTQHHLHNTTYYTTPSTLHHQTSAGAAFGALPYYPFASYLLIPLLLLFVVDCSDVRRHC